MEPWQSRYLSNTLPTLNFVTFPPTVEQPIASTAPTATSTAVTQAAPEQEEKSTVNWRPLMAVGAFSLLTLVVGVALFKKVKK